MQIIVCYIHTFTRNACVCDLTGTGCPVAVFWAYRLVGFPRSLQAARDQPVGKARNPVPKPGPAAYSEPTGA
ncbi:hypothetical protein PCANC_09774 [Puccinia coronata f. sp. avenae]|uniref:Uncharacterized protein n=1 Tax=Puccinia coronata f. sp. avenae TaxID=200324 RepID=A0A2N5VT52_9BASI|nr:hypothetical protein PCANC_22508 [Puccinia coronata f. sp. avenae]PLW53179.1 hypothetical protein PCANC_09774 [Puccinia coronata f. sp. avenae]